MKRIMRLVGIIIFLIIISRSYSDALCVNVAEANLRRGPGTRYQKTWEVFKYMPFRKLNKKGNWYKVKDVDGDIHWIYRKLVTKKFRCAVVKKDNVNIRSGPGTNYSKKYFGPAMKYDSFKVKKINGSWVKVLDEFGDTGWIFRKLVWIQ